jgi:hypothetical protein
LGDQGQEQSGLAEEQEQSGLGGGTIFDKWQYQLNNGDDSFDGDRLRTQFNILVVTASGREPAVILTRPAWPGACHVEVST